MSAKKRTKRQKKADVKQIDVNATIKAINEKAAGLVETCKDSANKRQDAILIDGVMPSILKMREANATFKAIAETLSKESGLDISVALLRKHYYTKHPEKLSKDSSKAKIKPEAAERVGAALKSIRPGQGKGENAEKDNISIKALIAQNKDIIQGLLDKGCTVSDIMQAFTGNEVKAAKSTIIAAMRELRIKPKKVKRPKTEKQEPVKEAEKTPEKKAEPPAAYTDEMIQAIIRKTNEELGDKYVKDADFICSKVPVFDYKRRGGVSIELRKWSYNSAPNDKLWSIVVGGKLYKTFTNYDLAKAEFERFA